MRRRDATLRCGGAAAGLARDEITYILLFGSRLVVKRNYKEVENPATPKLSVSQR